MVSIKPPKLNPGDTIGIISPSQNISGLEFMYHQGLKRLKELGFKLKIGKYVESSYYYSSGRPEERLEDIHTMFSDKEVKMILMTLGGDTANELLQGLDYQLIKDNPKIISGISDATTLLLPIHDKTGLVTFYGPDVLFTFGQEKNPYQIEQQIISAWTTGFINISPIDNLIDDYGKAVQEKWKVIRPGVVEGQLIGGYLSTIAILYASKQIGSLKGKILFLESMEESNIIHNKLQWLKLLGIFDEIAGLILGYFPDLNPDSKYYRDIGDIVLELTPDKTFPIFKVNELGHCIANYAWPIGAKVRLDANSGDISFLENCVE